MATKKKQPEAAVAAAAEDVVVTTEDVDPEPGEPEPTDEPDTVPVDQQFAVAAALTTAHNREGVDLAAKLAELGQDEFMVWLLAGGDE